MNKQNDYTDDFADLFFNLWRQLLLPVNSLPCNTLQHTAAHCNALQHLRVGLLLLLSTRPLLLPLPLRGACLRCCSVLRCVAVGCGDLRCVAVCCLGVGRWWAGVCLYGAHGERRGSACQIDATPILHARLPCVLPCVAVCCSVWQCVAVCCCGCCGVLQRVAACQCRHLWQEERQCMLTRRAASPKCAPAMSDAVCCIVWQFVAVCCSVLQCVAACQ